MSPVYFQRPLCKTSAALDDVAEKETIVVNNSERVDDMAVGLHAFDKVVSLILRRPGIQDMSAVLQRCGLNIAFQA